MSWLACSLCTAQIRDVTRGSATCGRRDYAREVAGESARAESPPPPPPPLGATASTRPDLQPQAFALIALVRLVAVLGLLGLTFGPPYAQLVLHVLYSSHWGTRESAGLLGTYCSYLLFLAVNGVTEAFVHAVSSGSQLHRANGWLLAFSLLHLPTCYLAIRRWGAAGLVLANCGNMALRIGYSLARIRSFFSGTRQFSLGQSGPVWCTWWQARPSAVGCSRPSGAQPADPAGDGGGGVVYPGG